MGLDAYIEVRAYDKKTHTKMLEMEISYFRKYKTSSCIYGRFVLQ